MDAEKQALVAQGAVALQLVASVVAVAAVVVVPQVHSDVQAAHHAVVRSRSDRRKPSTRSCTHQT